jgi:hypothetical protein
MVFDARKLAAELSLQPFEFIGMDGRTYQMPNINSLTGEQARRFKAGDEAVLEEIASPQAYEAIEQMPIGVQRRMAQDWVRHGGQPGKAASPSSPRRRPRRR